MTARISLAGHRDRRPILIGLEMVLSATRRQKLGRLMFSKAAQAGAFRSGSESSANGALTN